MMQANTHVTATSQAKVSATLLGHSDENLLSLFASTKDEAYFNELHHRYCEVTICYAQKVNQLGGRTVAEEVSQQAFLNVFLNHDQFDPEMKFRPWLFSIVANLAVNQRIAARRRPTASLEDLRFMSRYEEVVDYDPEDHREDSPVDQFAVAEQALELRSLVDSLPSSDREVMERLYYGHMTNEEAADDLGIPLGTLKTALHRSLKSLRRRIQRDDISKAA